ncbi:MAG: ribonuclease HI [Gammaproteobacteria bacterium]|nr:ribonuclease HI [Gammaproteobacteria bacterium]
MQLVIYTDGACRGNPGIGGWAAVLQHQGDETELSGTEENTTNNRMELTAAVRALEFLSRNSAVRLYTDSQYLRSGITTWINNWKRNGWRTSGGRPVKNKDLWQGLDEASQGHEIDWCWVKGHAGNAGNEHADALANQAIDRLILQQAAEVEDLDAPGLS